MAKRKTSAALFEVIARGNSKGIKTPSWVKARGAASGAAERSAMPLKHPPGLDDTDAPQPPNVEAAIDTEPIAKVAGGRLRLSLGYVSCVAISLGLIVVLAGVYKLGQSSRSAPTSETEAGMPPMFDGATDQTYDFDQVQAAAKDALPAAGRKILMIETNIASIDDAKAIQRYLQSKGVTTLVHSQDDWIAVLDTIDVSNMTDEDLTAYQDRLAGWGSDPQWLLGDRYKFNQTKTDTRNE